MKKTPIYHLINNNSVMIDGVVDGMKIICIINEEQIAHFKTSADYWFCLHEIYNMGWASSSQNAPSWFTTKGP